jgi:hypothetical protein
MLKDNRNFGGTYRLHHYGQKVSQEVNQHEAGRKHFRVSTLKAEETFSSETSANSADNTVISQNDIH